MQSFHGTFDDTTTRTQAGWWRSGDWRGFPASN
jgi:hypothetical protein